MIVEIVIGLMGIGIGAVWCWLIVDPSIPTDVVDRGYIGVDRHTVARHENESLVATKTKGKTT